MKSYVVLFVLLYSGLSAAKGNDVWTQWTNWTSCSKTCGCGSQYRTRDCNRIPESLGGPGCNGSSYSIRKCNDKPCPMWSNWTSFGPCTCSCGGGVKAQSRVCNRVPKALGGSGCLGKRIRILPCNNHPCPEVCNKSITKRLPDSSFSASTTYSSGYLPKFARLNSSGGWCPSTQAMKNDYLQIDFQTVHVVCGVATRSHASLGNHWSTKFKLALSLGGRNWQNYQEDGTTKVFSGNTDNNSIVKHSLKQEVRARYIRFIPTGSPSWPCLRAEVYSYK